MDKIIDKNWIKCALTRAIKTIAQSAAAAIGTAMVLSDVDWKYVVSASILAGILSIITSFAGLPEVKLIKQQEEEFGEGDEDLDDEVDLIVEEELGEDNAEEVEEV